MGSIIGSCVGSAMCTACCAGCGSCTPQNNKFGKASRLPYLFLIVLSGLVAVFMALYGEEELNLEFYNASICNGSDSCEGNGSVYRISFCFFVFELIHVLMVPFVNDFHWMFFTIKFLIYAIGVTITFVVSGSNNFFNGYATYFARYASILYLLIQILILIDWAWNINEWSQKKAVAYLESLNMDYEDQIENYNCCKNPYDLSRTVISVFLYVGSLILIGFFYDWYGSGSSCSLHQALITITIVILLINFLGSGAAGGGTFPVAAIMSTYAMFLLYSSMSATDHCNKYYSDTSAAMWIGIVFTLFALCYSAMKADLLGGAVDMTGVSCCGLCPGYNQVDDNENSSLLKSVNNDESNYNENAGLGATNYDDAATKDELKKEKEKESNDLEKGENDEKEESSKDKKEDEDDCPELTTKQKKQNTIYFHFILMLASCYLAMLFTDWGDSTSGIKTSGRISAWANIACQWLSMLLFWQSLFIFARERRANVEE